MFMHLYSSTFAVFVTTVFHVVTRLGLNSTYVVPVRLTHG